MSVKSKEEVLVTTTKLFFYPAVGAVAFLALISCSDTDRALAGGGVSINEPRNVGSSIYNITCQRGRLAECMVAANSVCDTGVDIIEQFSRTGFVKGSPAHIIDASFKCKT